MINLKYLGENTSYKILFKKLNSHVVQITGNFPVKEKGFTCYRDEEPDDPWDYKGFKTVYRTIENGVQFSDDGSVYVAPTEPEPVPDPEPHVPTPEELEAMFEQNKKDKVLLSKSLLAAYLGDHPITSTAHGGVEGVYSVTSEKQSLMMSQYMTYQIEKAVDPNAKLRWNETGKSCQDWTEEEFLQLVLEIKKYVYPLVSYQQSLEEQIATCTTQEQLDSIIIDYESVLSGKEE